MIARTTAFTYKGKAVDARQAARELGVRYVLEGSVRRMGERVQVNVQLIDGESGSHVWADRFDTDRRDLAEAQSEITGRLARTLGAELIRDIGRRIEQERAVDPDTRDIIMRGWAYLYRPSSAATRGEALRAFERALELDPSSSEARIGIATTLVHSVGDGWSADLEEELARAEPLMLEALERDPNSSAAHYAAGMVRRIQNRLEESQIEYQTAISLDRNHARAIFQLGQTLTWLGEPASGISHIEKSIRLNPQDPNSAPYYWALGNCYLFIGNHDTSIEFYRKAKARNPRVYLQHLNLAGALALRGDVDEAKAALSESLRLKPEINSLARYRAYRPWETGPAHWALRERTLNAGLRRVGFPEE